MLYLLTALSMIISVTYYMELQVLIHIFTIKVLFLPNEDVNIVIMFNQSIRPLLVRNERHNKQL